MQGAGHVIHEALEAERIMEQKANGKGTKEEARVPCCVSQVQACVGRLTKSVPWSSGMGS